MSVWYDARAAINPEGTVSVTNVAVQFFDPADTDYAAPLVVTDKAGVAYTSMHIINYLVPGFYGPDAGLVIAKSGDWTTPVEAVAGIRDAAVAAQGAAQAAQTAAEAAQAAAEAAASGTTAPTVDAINSVLASGTHNVGGTWDFSTATVIGVSNVSVTDAGDYLVFHVD